MSSEHSKMGHIQSLKTYLVIWVCLLILTVITVAVYYIFQSMGVESLVVRLITAMIIATVKASLVVLYFMHGKYEDKATWAFVWYPLIVLATLILFLYIDYGNRRDNIQVTDYKTLKGDYYESFKKYKAHKAGEHYEPPKKEAEGAAGGAAAEGDQGGTNGDGEAAHGDDAAGETDDSTVTGDEAAGEQPAGDETAAVDSATVDTATVDSAAVDTAADNSPNEDAPADPAPVTAVAAPAETVAAAMTGWGELPGDAAAGKEKAKILCIACHVIDGAGFKLPQAPPFEESANLERITPDFLRDWFTDPQKIKPGTLMPNLALSDEDKENLIAFMATYKND